MSKTGRRPKDRQDRKQLTKSLKKRLVWVISILSVILLVLLLKVGGNYWPAWLIDSRKLLITVLSFITIFVILLSPIIIEATINSRMLSGPGKNPEGPRVE